MPFQTVEKPDFKEFIHDLQPRYKIPNRRKIAKDVWSLFCEEKEKIKSIIGDLRVSITTDTWTSIQNINYMVVTAHFIDSDFNLHKRVLNFCKITSHKGEDIGRCLEEKLVEWGISKVFTITVDNASSNDVAVEYLKKQLRKQIVYA
ncbi:Zinc finger BED domain-containing protein DAYSLEEPER [Striga hermonthica]|uniref:Zinc finger BED domain-containing protein DAYSLEEPER n=1 Tax=Striga hermonthica TaxID=68872 RepID=A0A9N7MNC1_STRHE|nr:Zinc finger BED domain-containing protein DAYSLEEPER [Striga hermonthica]